jgi:hypothetical protein
VRLLFGVISYRLINFFPLLPYLFIIIIIISKFVEVWGFFAPHKYSNSGKQHLRFKADGNQIKTKKMVERKERNFSLSYVFNAKQNRIFCARCCSAEQRRTEKLLVCCLISSPFLSSRYTTSAKLEILIEFSWCFTPPTTQQQCSEIFGWLLAMI